MAPGESQQPELLVDFIVSLDGYAAADDWPGLWGLGGPGYFAWLEQLPENANNILMGATTYRLMSGFAAESEEAFAEMTARPKIVFSSTLEEPLSWSNSRLVAGDAVEEVRSLKENGDVSFSTVGSLSLCRSLLKAGLVDRLRLVVFPVITGRSGRERIYDDYPDVSLKLVNSQTLDGRLQLLEYVPTVLTEPPGSDAPMVSPVEDAT
ncbi:MAG: dihydrofolate reductase family protein [Aeromicrobium sp.]